MEKWILEADVYRLHKQLREGPSPEVRPRLIRLLEKKQAMLACASNKGRQG